MFKVGKTRDKKQRSGSLELGERGTGEVAAHRCVISLQSEEKVLKFVVVMVV